MLLRNFLGRGLIERLTARDHMLLRNFFEHVIGDHVAYVITIPVSYTHLDVYKRQIIYIRKSIWSISIC